MIYKQTVEYRGEMEAMKKRHEEQLATIMDALYVS